MIPSSQDPLSRERPLVLQASDTASGQTPPSSQPRRRRNFRVVSLVALFVVLVIGGGVWFLAHKRPGKVSLIGSGGNNQCVALGGVCKSASQGCDKQLEKAKSGRIYCNDPSLICCISNPSPSPSPSSTPYPSECQDGETKCQGNKVFVCSGKEWDLRDNCNRSNKVCKVSSSGVAKCVFSSGSCRSGDKRCNGNSVELCQDNKWVVEQTCSNDQVCEDTGGQVQCVANPCVTYYCSDDNKLYKNYCSGGKVLVKDCSSSANGYFGKCNATSRDCERHVYCSGSSCDASADFPGCYVNRWTCDRIDNLAGGCQDNLVERAVEKASFQESCGAEQIDVACNGYTVDSITKIYNQACAGKQSPSPRPSHSPTPSPNPTMACIGLSANTSDFVLGDTLTFTCNVQSSYSNTLTYEFRYKNPSLVDFKTVSPSPESSNQIDLTLDVGGEWTVECRGCITNDQGRRICSTVWQGSTPTNPL